MRNILSSSLIVGSTTTTTTRQCHSASIALMCNLSEACNHDVQRFRKTMEVYMDEMLVKSRIVGDCMEHLG